MSTQDPMLPLLFPLLQAFPAEQREALIAKGQEFDAPAGTQLWLEGQSVDQVLFFSSGTILAAANAHAGQRRFLYGHMAAGSIAGLHALFISEPMQIQLTVQEDAHYLQLPLADLRQALALCPAAWQAVAQELAHGVYHLINTINLISQSNGYHRLRRLLIQLDRRASKSGHQKSGLVLSQQEIAERIGLSREMVNRMLTQLRNGNYITQDERGVFRILQALPHEF
ncbi:Crp/Fnr family transcriptional regulator [Chitinibacter sp. SCUT-21]|uniref:Crp/Fnr family transcriptional regulator n=1 Tax=Chitinibacter sp. SCUT-21 TaxID=2970891 RepID=UPI0035A738AF